MKAIFEKLNRKRPSFFGVPLFVGIVFLLPSAIGLASRCAGYTTARNLPEKVKGCRFGLFTSNPTASCSDDGICLVCYDTPNNSECRAILVEWCK